MYYNNTMDLSHGKTNNLIATVGVVKQLISYLPCNKGTEEAIQGDSNDDWDSLLTSSPLVIIQGFLSAVRRKEGK